MTDINTLQALNEHVYLLSSSTHWWRGDFQPPGAETRINTADGKEIILESDRVTPGQIHLLSKAWRDRFQAVDSAKSRVENNFSRRFPGIKGVRLVSKSRLSGYLAAMEEPRELFNRVVEDFCERFTENVQAIAAALGPEVWQLVQHRVPASPEAFRAKAYISTVRIQLSGGEDYETLDDATLRSQIGELQARTHQMAAEAIEELVRGPRIELAKAVQNLEELIQRDGRCTTRSFAPIRRLVEQLNDLSFITDADLLNRIKSFEKRLDGYTPAELNSSSASQNGLFTACREIRDTILDAERMQADMARFGQAPRRMKLN